MDTTRATATKIPPPPSPKNSPEVACSLSHLADQEHEYGVYLWRHRQRHVIALPLINGGQYHEQSIYLPIPQCPLFSFPKAQETYPYLLPTFIFANGVKATPTAFYKNIRASFDEDGRGSWSGKHPF